MATRIIPTRSDLGAYFFQIELDRIVFTLRFQFNDREGFWYFDLIGADAQVIRGSIKVVSNFPLLRLITDLARPPGEIIALDTTGQGIEATLESLGSEVLLAYEDAATVP